MASHEGQKATRTRHIKQKIIIYKSHFWEKFIQQNTGRRPDISSSQAHPENRIDCTLDHDSAARLLCCCRLEMRIHTYGAL